MKRVLRCWCRLIHRAIMFAGGATYECRTCGERFPNPALDGPLKNLPKPRSVRIVDTPIVIRTARRKVAAMPKRMAQ